MIGLNIIKKVQEAYNKNGNEHFRKKINLLLVGLKIIKKMQKVYGDDGNGHLKKEINLFINKK